VPSRSRFLRRPRSTARSAAPGIVNTQRERHRSRRSLHREHQGRVPLRAPARRRRKPAGSAPKPIAPYGEGSATGQSAGSTDLSR
jgi:hypothetical protein